MAEALFREMTRKSGQSHVWRIDSAGIHASDGSPPSDGTLRILSENSIPIGELRARKIEDKDFREFDFILSMDEWVMEKLVRQKPKDSKAKLELLRRYDPEQKVFKDPYEGTKQDFEEVFRQCEVCLTQFLGTLCRNDEL